MRLPGAVALAFLLCVTPAQAAVTYVANGAGVFADNAAVSPSMPTGLQVGDVVLCFATALAEAPASFTLSGSGWFVVPGFPFASATNPNMLYLAYLVADGTDAAPTFTPTGTFAGDTIIARCTAWRGVDTANPFDVISASLSENASAQNIGPVAAITPTASDSIVLVLFHKGDDFSAITTLTGDGLTWVGVGFTTSVTGNDAGLVMQYADWTGAPPTLTAKTMTITGGSPATGAGVMLSLNPIGGGGGGGGITPKRLLLGVGDEQ